MGGRNLSPLQRLIAMVQCPEGCWPIKNLPAGHRYGHLGIDGRQVPAHRASYEIFVGPIPSGMHVLHSCDNSRCCNPAHLHLGTHADNMREMAERGRARTAANPVTPRLSGEDNAGAKLTWESVAQIRERYARGQTGQKELAAEFGVCLTTISKIICGKSWVTPPDRAASDSRGGER